MPSTSAYEPISHVSETYDELLRDVNACAAFESLVCGKGMPKAPKGRSRRRGNCNRTAHSALKIERFDIYERVSEVVKACRASRKRALECAVEQPSDDKTLCKMARFTDGQALAPYAPFLHYVPRLVNIVTLAEAIPMPGSGLTLPLDLFHIASRCNGAYFAKKRFAAVQLAYTHPRCRVLVFHTGRLVGTGCSGAMAARLAIARAQRQLADEADVHLHVRNFAVINQVGASSLRATLNCEAFAEAHPHDSHHDRQAFVGLAWRPEGEQICCEIYSTGKANLPGSRTERALNTSFYRMLPELLRFSSASRLTELVPEEVRNVHIPSRAVRALPVATVASTALHPPGTATGVPVGVPVKRVQEISEQEEQEDEDEDEDEDEELDDDLLEGLGL